MLTTKRTTEEIFNAVESALPLFHQQHKNLAGRGFAITLITKDTGFDQTPARRTFDLIGPKSSTFTEESSRKAIELKRAHERARCMGSFELLDAANKDIGGAVVGTHYYLGGAGFESYYDQKFLLFVSTLINELTYEGAGNIEARSRPYIETWKKNNCQHSAPVASR